MLAGDVDQAGVPAVHPHPPPEDRVVLPFGLAAAGLVDAQHPHRRQLGRQGLISDGDDVIAGGVVSWQVENPVLNGDQLDAQLAVTIPIFGTKSHNIYWVNQDGAWKLSNPSACVIANDVAGVSCTV